MLPLVTTIQAYLLTRRRPAWLAPPDRTRSGQAGQATAEYALVLLAAATVALIVLAWAAKTGKVGDLFDKVFDSLISKVT